jgi:hypothetical protein
VDDTEQVVYWTKDLTGSGNYAVEKTYYNKTTVRLKVFNGAISSIRLAQGERYLYVLNPALSQLEVIDKETEEVVVTYDVKSGTNAVGAAEGKFSAGLQSGLSKLNIEIFWHLSRFSYS